MKRLNLTTSTVHSQLGGPSFAELRAEIETHGFGVLVSILTGETFIKNTRKIPLQE